MGKVVKMESRAVSDNMRTLLELMELEQRGELGALLTVYEGPGGNGLAMTGSFADRMQYGAFAMIKALNTITDLIDESGLAGHTHSAAVRQMQHRPVTAKVPARGQINNLGKIQ